MDEAYNPTDPNAFQAEITFDGFDDDEEEGDPIFRPGETVSGRAKCRIQAAGLVCKGLQIRIVGRGQTRFFAMVLARGGRRRRPERGRRGDFDKVEYKDEERYFEWSRMAYGDGDQLVQLRSGHHEFRFSATLPETGLPNTFVGGEHGFVSYYVIVQVLKEGFGGMLKRRQFIVQATAGGSGGERAAAKPSRPIADTLTQNTGCLGFCCCCSCTVCSWISGGSIVVGFDIDRTEFFRGETLPIRVKVDNQSSGGLQVTAALELDIVYRGYDDWEDAFHRWPETAREDGVEVAKVFLGGLAPGQDVTLAADLKLERSFPPAPLENCALIEASYALRVRFVPSSDCDPGFVLESDVVIR